MVHIHKVRVTPNRAAGLVGFRAMVPEMTGWSGRNIALLGHLPAPSVLSRAITLPLHAVPGTPGSLFPVLSQPAAKPAHDQIPNR